MKKLIFYFALISLGAFFAGRFLYYNKKVMDICNNSFGESSVVISERVVSSGLQFSGNYDAKGIIHSTKNFGRGVCLIKIEKGKITQAIYDFD